MSSPREGVNPLRPYYIPPSIGEQVQSLPSQPNPFSSPSSHGNATSAATPNKYASRARDIFSDIDYSDQFDDLSPSTVQSIKQFVDELLWKYTSVLMAQPFEVAKTILQARSQDDLGGLSIPSVGVAKPTPSLVTPSLATPELTPKSPWAEVCLFIVYIVYLLNVCRY